MLIKFAFFLLKLLSKLPVRVLFAFSTFLYWVLRIIGYRKSIIKNNLRICFPEKSQEEIRAISHEFYKYFSDYFVEIIIAFSAHPEDMVGKRVSVRNVELLEEAKALNKEVFVLAPHVFSWEWVAFFGNYMPQSNIYGIYKPLKNPYVDKKIQEVRFRTGGLGLSTKEVFEFIFKGKNNPDNLYYFIVDQSPRIDKIKTHISFFGKKTAVIDGYEVLIRKKKAVVLYCEPVKIKRGKYEYVFTKIDPENEEFEKHEVVKKFYLNLENTIRKNPSAWLWSHKRWKD